MELFLLIFCSANYFWLSLQGGNKSDAVGFKRNLENDFIFRKETPPLLFLLTKKNIEFIRFIKYVILEYTNVNKMTANFILLNKW